jgi:hypothetical protein
VRVGCLGVGSLVVVVADWIGRLSFFRKRIRLYWGLLGHSLAFTCVFFVLEVAYSRARDFSLFFDLPTVFVLLSAGGWQATRFLRLGGWFGKPGSRVRKSTLRAAVQEEGNRITPAYSIFILF